MRNPARVALRHASEDAPSLASATALADLVAHCLAKDPALRPPDGTALARELSEIRGLARAETVRELHRPRARAWTTSSDAASLVDRCPGPAVQAATSPEELVEQALADDCSHAVLEITGGGAELEALHAIRSFRRHLPVVLLVRDPALRALATGDERTAIVTLPAEPGEIDRAVRDLASGSPLPRRSEHAMQPVTTASTDVELPRDGSERTAGGPTGRPMTVRRLASLRDGYSRNLIARGGELADRIRTLAEETGPPDVREIADAARALSASANLFGLQRLAGILDDIELAVGSIPTAAGGPCEHRELRLLTLADRLEAAFAKSLTPAPSPGDAGGPRYRILSVSPRTDLGPLAVAAQVDAAPDLESATRAMELHAPDALIMDVDGPDGLDSALELASEFEGKVLWVASDHDPETRLAAVRAGASLCTRPLDPRILLDRLEPSPAESGDPLRVLVVDDDPVLAELYRVWLESEAMRVDVATDAVSAIRTFDTSPRTSSSSISTSAPTRASRSRPPCGRTPTSSGSPSCSSRGSPARSASSRPSSREGTPSSGNRSRRWSWPRRSPTGPGARDPSAGASAGIP